MKNKMLVALLLVAALIFAFWYGGDMPGSKGLDVFSDKTEISTTIEPENENIDNTEVDDTEIDDTEVDDVEVDDTEVDDTEVDDVEVDDTEIDDTDVEVELDQYQTEEVPDGKPEPVEPENAVVGTNSYTCTISIVCKSILDNMELCDPNKVELVPENGVLLPPTEVVFYEGESVFNVLLRTCKQNSLHMEYVNTPIYNSAYIEGIGNIYEFDVGEGSGWMYEVNDWFPNYGVSRYQLSDGDVIEFQYTCDLGDDIGGGNSL